MMQQVARFVLAFLSYAVNSQMVENDAQDCASTRNNELTILAVFLEKHQHCIKSSLTLVDSCIGYDRQSLLDGRV